MEGELSHVFPNLLKHNEGDSCRLEIILRLEGFQCSLTNNIGHFATVLLILLLIKILVSMVDRFTPKNYFSKSLSRINMHFGFDYLIIILNSFEIDIFLSTTVFFFKSKFQSPYYIMEIFLAFACLLILFLTKMLRWVSLFSLKTFKKNSTFDRIVRDYLKI